MGKIASDVENRSVLAALARFGSFRKAAEAMGVATSTFQNRVAQARAAQPPEGGAVRAKQNERREIGRAHV